MLKTYLLRTLDCEDYTFESDKELPKFRDQFTGSHTGSQWLTVYDWKRKPVEIRKNSVIAIRLMDDEMLKDWYRSDDA